MYDCSLWRDQTTNTFSMVKSPIIQIEVTEQLEYYKKCPQDYFRSAFDYRTHKELIDDGWTFEGRDFIHRPVYMEDGTYIHMECEDDNKSTRTHQVVVCDWPPEEDDRRFAEIRYDLERELERAEEIASQREAKRTVAT
jgi:hypothetical protein